MTRTRAPDLLHASPSVSIPAAQVNRSACRQAVHFPRFNNGIHIWRRRGQVHRNRIGQVEPAAFEQVHTPLQLSYIISIHANYHGVRQSGRYDCSCGNTGGSCCPPRRPQNLLRSKHKQDIIASDWLIMTALFCATVLTIDQIYGVSKRN